MKKLLLFSILLFPALFLHAQVTRFSKTFDIWNEGAMNNFQQTADGGYILSTDAMPEQDTAVIQLGYGYLVKMDALGNTQWIKKYRKTNYFIKATDGNSVFQTKDGGYIIGTVLYTSSSNTNNVSGNNSIYLIKTDASGNFSWSKTYPGIGNSTCFCIKQTVDFGYIVCGTTTDTVTNTTKSYLLKTDIAGNVQWGKTYEEISAGQNGNAYCVNQTSDGGYVVTGTSFSGTFLMKTDGNGNIVWNHNMGMAGTDILYCANQTYDGGYVACGYGATGSHWGTTLLKLDGNGNSQWEKEYDLANSTTSSDEGFSVCEVPGGYAVLYSVSDGYNGLMKTDISGNVQWSRVERNINTYSPSGIQKTTDGGYAFSSATDGTASAFGGCIVVKTDSMGLTNCTDSIQPLSDTVYAPIFQQGFIVTSVAPSYTVNTVFINPLISDSLLCPTQNQDGIPNFSNENSVSVFPNPTSGNISIQMNSVHGNKISIAVFDVLGQSVMEKENDNVSGIFQQTLDLSAMSDGIYFVAIKVDDKIISTKKIVKGN